MNRSPSARRQGLLIAAVAAAAVLLIALIVVMVRHAPGKAAKAELEAQTDIQAQTEDAADAAEADPVPAEPDTAEAQTEAVVQAEPLIAAIPTADLPEGIVMVCGDLQLTGRDFNYYYWDTFYKVVETYGTGIYQYFDPDTPLDQQSYDEANTWQDAFLSMTVSSIVQTLTFADLAQQAAFELPEEAVQSLRDLMDGYAQLAEEAGYDSLDAYLQATYGAQADTESFRDYQQTCLLASAYSDQLYSQPEFTDQEIEAYFDDYAEEYAAYGIEKTDEPMVNLRHIMLLPEDPEDEESWSRAEAELQEIYDQWLAGDATEESFAALAEEYSQDGASVGNGGDWTQAFNGGLYQQVYNGAMDEAFTQWLFQEDRQPGDTAMIRSASGWHLLYYASSDPEAYWHYAAELDLRYETYTHTLDALLSEDPDYALDLSQLTIAVPAGLYGPEE